MNVDFKNLGLLEQISNDLILLKKHLLSDSSDSKRWLSTKELSLYIPYSKESINKKVQDETFICGVHFYQNQKIRMFDKHKIDEWVMNNQLSSKQEFLKQNILDKIKSDF